VRMHLDPSAEELKRDLLMSIRAFTFTILVTCLCAWPFARAEAGTILSVDFEGITTGNATATRLNSGGTTGGTWVVNNRQESTIRLGGGNQVLNVDRGLYNFDLGSFLAAPLNGASLSYDTFIQRTAGGANAKKNFFFGDDSSGDEIFRLVLTTDGSSNPLNGRLKYVDSSGAEITVIDGLNSEGGNGFTNSRLQNIRLEFNTTGYDIYVEDTLELANAEYRTAFGSLDGIANLSFRGSGNAANNSNTAGAFYDNITITVIPEPATATLAMLGLGGLLMRRRRAA
jgi:hypothetical protein